MGNGCLPARSAQPHAVPGPRCGDSTSLSYRPPTAVIAAQGDLELAWAQLRLAMPAPAQSARENILALLV